jgi:hypothetical protein
MLALAESGVRAGQLGRAISHPLFQLLMGTLQRRLFLLAYRHLALQLRVLRFELLLRLAQAQVRRDPRYHLSNLEWFYFSLLPRPVVQRSSGLGWAGRHEVAWPHRRRACTRSPRAAVRSLMPEIESLPEIRSDAFARALLDAGIDVVQDRCTLADHRSLGLGKVVR